MEIDNQKEQIRWREVVRLMQLSRDESIDNLLSAALAGRETNVISVTKLYRFVLRNFGASDGMVPSKVTLKLQRGMHQLPQERRIDPGRTRKGISSLASCRRQRLHQCD